MLHTIQCEKSTSDAGSARQSSQQALCTRAPSRHLTTDDRARVLAHLLRLNAQDRRMRFCQSFSDANVTDYVANIDFDKSVCFGLFDDGQNLVALAQSFAYDDGGVRMLEAAFSTDAAWRCQGLGTVLFRQVTDFAAEQRMDRVIAQCLAGNRPMRALLRAVGAVCAVDDGEVTGQLEIVGHA